MATANADLTTAQSQIESLESDVSSANSRASSANSKLSAAQSELRSYKSDLNSAWTPLVELLTLYTFALAISSSVILDDLDDVYQGCLIMTMTLPALGDPELDALWKEAFVSNSDGWSLYHLPFDSFLERLAERAAIEREAFNNKLQE